MKGNGDGERDGDMKLMPISAIFSMALKISIL
jgi:hypothetical protein